MSPFRASAPFTKRWKHFRFSVEDGVATLTFNRPEVLNALTFEAYADLRDLLAELPHRDDVKVVVITGTGRGFCSGGDVHEIIGALQKMDAKDLLEFTRMTGAVVQRMRDCPLPIIAAINGVAAGADRSLRWRPTSASWPDRPRSPFCSRRWGLRGRTWARPTSCRA